MFRLNLQVPCDSPVCPRLLSKRHATLFASRTRVPIDAGATATKGARTKGGRAKGGRRAAALAAARAVPEAERTPDERRLVAWARAKERRGGAIDEGGDEDSDGASEDSSDDDDDSDDDDGAGGAGGGADDAPLYRVEVVDHGSTNGTAVNGAGPLRAGQRSAPLRHGDVVVLGACPRQNQLGVAARAAVAYRLMVPSRAKVDAWERAGLLPGVAGGGTEGGDG